MKRISMKKIKEILKLKYITNISIRAIGRAVNVPPSTVSDYCKRFEKTGYTIDEILKFNEEKIYQHLFPEKKIPKIKKKDKPLPDFAYIHKEIAKKGVTFELLWMEYKEQYPNGYEISQFKKLYYKFKNKINPTMRQTYIPGDQMFVDYSGLIVPYCDSKSGEIFKAQIFVSVLGNSGYVFVHATPSQKQEYFIKSHILAYEFYGGVPKVNVPDNLKSAVISNNKKGIVINESYAEMCRHYNCAVQPARPKKPQDKGIVEQAVQGIQRWILAVFRDRTFFSVDEINQAIAPLLDIYNNKVIKFIGKSRYELFEEQEKQQLQPLPTNRYLYKEIKIAIVDISYHVQLLKCFYSVPFKYLKEKVEVKYSTTLVEIYHKSKLISTHPRLIRVNDRSTLKEHMPKNHQLREEKMNPERLLNWALSIGKNTEKFVQHRLNTTDYPANIYTSIIAVLSKAKIYGNFELDLALTYALCINAKSVKSIESILSKKLYKQSANNTTNPVLNNHKNIRGSNYYK
jgi:transposase